MFLFEVVNIVTMFLRPVDEDDVTMETDGSDQIMGTVIVHINFAIRQDQDLGREFIKFIKVSKLAHCQK